MKQEGTYSIMLRPVAAAAVLGFSLVAATTPARAQEGLGTADAPVELRIVANEAFANSWQETLVPEFNKTYPHVRVTIDGVPYSEQLAKMMLDAINADPLYDLLLVDDPWIPQMAEIGALENLRGDRVAAMTDADYDWDDFAAAPLAAGSWEGEQYGIPVRSNMLMMFYNRTLYEGAGLPAPTPELTWDEFFEQAPQLVRDTDGDGKDDVWAIDTYFTRDSLTPTIWQAILGAYGGVMLNEDGTVAFNSEAGVTALDTHRRLVDYAPPGALGHGFTESLQAFRQGMVATMFQWGSVYKATAVSGGATTLTEDEVGIQVMPVGTDLAGTHRGIWSMAMSSKTEHPEAAWAFAQWLTSKEGEQFNLSSVGSFPARKSTLTGTPPEPWMEPVFEALLNAYEVAAEGQMWRIRSPKSDAAQQILADEVARAIAGQITSEEALSLAAEKVQKVLD